MRATRPIHLALVCAVLLILGAMMVIPGHAAPAGPPTCAGQPATIVGTIDDDELVGTPDDDVIVGLEGNDLIYGKGGDDVICAGPGHDTIVSGQGDDVVFGQAGKDWIDYRAAPGRVTVILSDWTAMDGHGGNDHLFGVEHVYGSAHNDLLMGDAGVNRLVGGPGHDTLRGRAGNDILIGGSGRDIASFCWSPLGVNVNLVYGTATGDGTDTLTSIEHLAGSGYRDILRGNSLVNRLVGFGGNDTLLGGAADDTVKGGPGNDYLDGGPGTDALNGGPDDDECTRGEAYESCEVIL